MLSPFVSANHQRDWDEHVDLVLMAYRSSVQASTGFTPSMLHISREIRLPIDMIFGSPKSDKNNNESKSQFVHNLKRNLNEIYNIATKNMNMAQDIMETNYDVKIKYNIYKENDAVWYYNPIRAVLVRNFREHELVHVK